MSHSAFADSYSQLQLFKLASDYASNLLLVLPLCFLSQLWGSDRYVAIYLDAIFHALARCLLDGSMSVPPTEQTLRSFFNHPRAGRRQFDQQLRDWSRPSAPPSDREVQFDDNLAELSV